MAPLSRFRWFLSVLRATFAAILADVERGIKMRPIGGADGAEGEGGEGGKEADTGKEGKPDKEDGAEADAAEDEGDEEKVGKEDDWETKARKHERRAKRERKAREDAEAKARKLEDRNKSEAQKAIDKAREEGKAEALTEAEKERRSDRLEVAVTRLASRGLTLGEGDDAETKRFADTDDALLNIERAISRGDIDEGDIFDDQGKVDSDALKGELADLLKRKPHLAADGAERPNPGDNDARKGGAAKTDLEEMSPEDHAKRKYPQSK